MPGRTAVQTGPWILSLGSWNLKIQESQQLGGTREVTDTKTEVRMRGREVKSKWEFVRLGQLPSPLSQRRSSPVPESLRGDQLLTTWKSSRTIVRQESTAAQGSSKSMAPGMPETPNHEVGGFPPQSP